MLHCKEAKYHYYQELHFKEQVFQNRPIYPILFIDI
jgi:hypothetical protein